MQKSKKFRPNRVIGARKFDPNKARNDQYKTQEWTAFRFRFLHHNPKCYACHLPSAHVDHLVPARVDEEGFYRKGNHVPLCHSCHSTVTRLFDQFTPPKTQEKIEWLEKQRKLRGLIHAIRPIGQKD